MVNLGSPGPSILSLHFHRTLSRLFFCQWILGSGSKNLSLFHKEHHRDYCARIFLRWELDIIRLSHDDPFIFLFSQNSLKIIIESHIFPAILSHHTMIIHFCITFSHFIIFYSLTLIFLLLFYEWFHVCHGWLMEPSPFRIIDIAWKEQVPSGKDVGATNGAKLYSFVSYWNIWIG